MVGERVWMWGGKDGGEIRLGAVCEAVLWVREVEGGVRLWRELIREAEREGDERTSLMGLSASNASPGDQNSSVPRAKSTSSVRVWVLDVLVL